MWGIGALILVMAGIGAFAARYRARRREGRQRRDAVRQSLERAVEGSAPGSRPPVARAVAGPPCSDPEQALSRGASTAKPVEAVHGWHRA